MMIFWIFLVLLMVYWISDPGEVSPKSVPLKNAFDILRERYARGEIEHNEFEERLRELRK